MMFHHLFRGQRLPSSEAGALLPHLLEHNRRFGQIRCPLVLISQISRSGGTWLSQLFDHHPQIWAHPHELKIGYPRKWDWPDLSSVAMPADVWRILRDEKAEVRFGMGSYSKGTDETHPMLFDAELQQALFLALAAKARPTEDREWLDLYFTSLFGAWLDYQRRYGPKQYVTAFASMLALQPASMSRFRAAYPDGWLISLIREPLGWYASVKQRSSGDDKHKGTVKRHYAGPEEAEAAYLDNVRAMRDNRALFEERFIVVDYDALVADLEATMRSLAERIGLDWHPALTYQTFNGMPIKPNTSFKGDRASARATMLTEEEVNWITAGPMMVAYRAARPSPGS